MRQKLLFLSRFMITLWLILASTFTYLLMVESPSSPNVPFANISISVKQDLVIRLPNRIFTCIETDQGFQCNATIQGHPLELSWTKSLGYLENCQAVYAGRTVTCQQTDEDYIGFKGLLSHFTLIDSLGLNKQQIQELQQKYWGINILMELDELRLLQIGIGLSIMASIITAFLAWQRPSQFINKVLTSFACGFGALALANIFFFFNLIALGYAD